jgi:hypothetical protein
MFKTFRFGATVALLVSAVAVCGVVACQGSDSSPAAQATTPPANAKHHKMGMDINNASEVGTVVAQLAVAETVRASDLTLQIDASTGVYLASGDTAFAVVGPGTQTIPIANCVFTPNAALTASNTNYGTVSIYKRPGQYSDAGSGTLIASVATAIPPAADAGVTNASGNWLAFGSVNIPPVSGAYVSPGDVISYSTTKAGTGVALPQGTISCYTNVN